MARRLAATSAASTPVESAASYREDAEFQNALPSPVARRLWWHVLGIGGGRYERSARWAPFLHAGAALLWVESGSGTLEIGSNRWRLERGNKFWMFDFVKPRTFTPAGALVVRSMVFDGPGLHAWLEELGGAARAEFEFSRDAAARMRAEHARLRRLVRDRRSAWEWEVHVTITRMLREFFAARKLLDTDATTPPEPIGRALRAIAAEPFRDWQAYELAAVAGLSYWPFRRLFRRHLRETVHTHLQRRRADAAKLLLADPTKQIKAVAQQLHFASGRYFSHFFRSQTGVSPSEYRRELGHSRAGE